MPELSLLPEPELAAAVATPQVVDHVAVARLYGEPLFAVPQDLYIPPDALEVFLEAFEGPLDLLLYLIRSKTSISLTSLWLRLRGNIWPTFTKSAPAIWSLPPNICLWLPC